jgi:hypothetical protein
MLPTKYQIIFGLFIVFIVKMIISQSKKILS